MPSGGLLLLYGCVEVTITQIDQSHVLDLHLLRKLGLRFLLLVLCLASKVRQEDKGETTIPRPDLRHDLAVQLLS